MHFEYRDTATSPLPCWCEIGQNHRGALAVTPEAAAMLPKPTTRRRRHRADAPLGYWLRRAG